MRRRLKYEETPFINFWEAEVMEKLSAPVERYQNRFFKHMGLGVSNWLRKRGNYRF